MLLLSAAVVLALSVGISASHSPDAACRIELVESVPENLTFNSTFEHLRTFQAYKWLVKVAEKELNFAQLYWTLRCQDMPPCFPELTQQGDELFNLIANTSVPVRIAYNSFGLSIPLADVKDLAKLKHVQAVGLNFSRIFGQGVLHTKIVTADAKHAYVGSSNMDWRSLTQIQEFGLLMTNCPTLADDLNKVFRIYYLTGQQDSVPNPWPTDVIGGINATHPWMAKIGRFKYSIFVGASPSSLCPPNRSRDIDAILSAIAAAKKFVHIAVMDYMAELLSYDSGPSVFWPEIDVALREAAFRGVHVRLLASHWQHSRLNVARFVRSLTALNSSRVRIEGRFYVVPAYSERQARIPFARVNHNKFMVTETTAIICTSNWEGSYFTNTAGVAVSITELSADADQDLQSDVSIVTQVQRVFERDWTSPYAHEQPPTNGETASLNKNSSFSSLIFDDQTDDGIL